MPEPAPPPAHLQPREVPWHRAFAWYEEAMRLFKFAPLTFIGLAFLTIATELLLKAAPGGFAFAGEIFTPLVACGLIYASAAADRGQAPSLLLAAQVFRAGGGAMVAIVAASLVNFAAQAIAAWWIADANLLEFESMAQLSVPAVLGIYAFGAVAALPVTFVPLLVLLERVPPSAAFMASGAAFARNTSPLLVYGAASLVLLAFGLLTAGLGLALALPLWAASSYAAWKDVFGVRDAPAP
jgi:uncharacterized membrane protein